MIPVVNKLHQSLEKLLKLTNPKRIRCTLYREGGSVAMVINGNTKTNSGGTNSCWWVGNVLRRFENARGFTNFLLNTRRHNNREGMQGAIEVSGLYYKLCRH